MKAQASQTAALQQQNKLLTQQMLLLQQWLSAAPRLQMPLQSPSPSAAPDVLNPLQPPLVPSPGPKVHSEGAMLLEPRPAPLLQANQQQLGLLSNKVHSQVQPAATPNRAAELEMAVQPLQCSSAPQSDAAVAASEAGQPSAALALTPAATPSAQKEVSLLANPVTLLPSGAPDLRRQAPRVLAGCTGWQWLPQHDAARAHCCRWPFHTRPGEPRSHDLICGKPCQCPPTCCANHGGFVVRASRGLWLPLLWDGADSLLCACRLQRLPLTAATPAQRKRLCMQVCSPFKAR